MASDSAVQAVPRLARTLYAIRWLIILGVLAESQLKFLAAGWDTNDIVIAAAAMAALTLAAGVKSSLFGSPRTPGIIVLADIAFVSFVVYKSDGLQSPLYPLYYIVVITAAVLISTRAAVLTALGASVLLVGIELGEAGGFRGADLLPDDIIRTFPYLFLIAVITGLMMDRIRVLGETTAALRESTARTESELAVARQVQKSQLPAHVPEVEGIQIEAVCRPAREVGGDIYDFYPIQERLVGVMVADVCGKGVPAALLVASAKYSVREHYCRDLASTIQGASAHIYSVTRDDTFVTMTYGVFDIGAGEFRYVNAGGMPPILLRSDGSVDVISYADPPLGIADSYTYSEHTVPLRDGDTVILYTDGVSDALADGGDGVDRLVALVRETGFVPLPELRQRILAGIEPAAHIDDVTLVAVRVG